ncbi:MAG: DUF6111 family protein [Kiloniellales bacterium]
MLRILLTVVLPVLLPLAAFALYLLYARRRASAEGEPPPGWAAAPWPWLGLVGLALVVVALLLVQNGSVEPGVELVPPHVEDGRVVPSAPKE